MLPSAPLIRYFVTTSLICLLVIISLLSIPRRSNFFQRRLQVESLFSSSLEKIGFSAKEASCSPHNHILFLKTHKCASTTVQNIFLRYGYKNDLMFALPAHGNYLGNGNYFKAAMIPKNLTPKNGLMDIFCVHSRLQVEELNKILHKDTIWITILREPGHLQESLFNFYHMNNFYKMNFQEFLQLPSEDILNWPRFGDKLGPNQMLYDLGAKQNLNSNELQNFISKLEQRFDLVLIAERMDESLILMKEELCWSMEDVVYFTKNARRKEAKNDATEDSMKKMKEVNEADSVLYDHFLSIHRKKVREFGEERMRMEVEALRELVDDVKEDCQVREVEGWDEELEFKEYSAQVSGFVLGKSNDENCRLLVYPELPFLEEIRERQKKREKKKGQKMSKKV